MIQTFDPYIVNQISNKVTVWLIVIRIGLQLYHEQFSSQYVFVNIIILQGKVSYERENFKTFVVKRIAVI